MKTFFFALYLILGKKSEKKNFAQVWCPIKEIWKPGIDLRTPWKNFSPRPWLYCILVYAHYKDYSYNVNGAKCPFQRAPKEKLLVLSVKKGWEPLCKFLEKEVPDKPFPWKNIGGKGAITEENIQHFNRKIMMELLTFLLLFCSFSLLSISMPTKMTGGRLC